MDPLVIKRPNVAGVDLKRVEIFIALFQNVLGVGLGVGVSILLPHFFPGTAMRVAVSAAAVHLLATRWTLLPAAPFYVRRFQKLLFFIGSCLWARLLVLEVEGADDVEHEINHAFSSISPLTIAVLCTLMWAAVHAVLFPARPDANLGTFLLYAGLLFGLLFCHLPLEMLDVVRPLSTDLFRSDGGVNFAACRVIRSIVFLIVAHTQAFCELSDGNMLELEELQRIGLRALEASMWTLAVPVTSLPFAVFQIALTLSRRAGLWGTNRLL